MPGTAKRGSTPDRVSWSRSVFSGALEGARLEKVPEVNFVFIQFFNIAPVNWDGPFPRWTVGLNPLTSWAGVHTYLFLSFVFLIIIKKLSMGAGEMFSHLSWELMNDINVSYCFYLRCFYATYLILT